MASWRRRRRWLGAAVNVLQSMSPGELVMLLQAPLALFGTAVGIRRYGLRRVLTFLVGRRPSVISATDADTLTEARRVAWIVHIAAKYVPWRANCLHRSVVLWWFLRRRGLAADLRIGVRRNPEIGSLDFHAWIEHDDTVLNDARDVRERYAAFDRAIVPPGALFG